MVYSLEDSDYRKASFSGVLVSSVNAPELYLEYKLLVVGVLSGIIHPRRGYLNSCCLLPPRVVRRAYGRIFDQ